MGYYFSLSVTFFCIFRLLLYEEKYFLKQKRAMCCFLYVHRLLETHVYEYP